jgi:hypothetical protein
VPVLSAPALLYPQVTAHLLSLRLLKQDLMIFDIFSAYLFCVAICAVPAAYVLPGSRDSEK